MASAAESSGGPALPGGPSLPPPVESACEPSGPLGGELPGQLPGQSVGQPLGDVAARRRPRPGAQIVLLDSSELVEMTQTLAHSSARGVLCTQGLGIAQVMALRAGLSRLPSVRRPLHPLLALGTAVHSRLVSDYRGKDYTVAEVGTWASGLGLAPRFLAALEQALDEMLMNALFAAPRNASGGPRYSHLPASARVALVAPPDEQAVVRYGADARRVVIAVRDRFGALRAATVLGYLIRCAESQRLRKSPIEDKLSGSGVGLFLITTAASELLFRLRRGRLTELIFTLYRDRPRPLRALVFDDDAPTPPSPATPER